MKIATDFTGLLLITFGISTAVLADQEIPIKTVYSSVHCGISQQALRRINSQSELSQLLEVMLSGLVPRPSIKIDVDFAKESLVIFALGQKPSAGFNLKLDKNQAIISARKLYLPIRIIQPEPGSFQAQVLTSPCQIYSIPNVEFTEILLEDYAEQ